MSDGLRAAAERLIDKHKRHGLWRLPDEFRDIDIALSQPLAGVDAKKPKPDGWHTYHICGGLLQELTWSGRDAMCVVCGQWFRAVVTPDAALSSPETTPAGVLPERTGQPPDDTSGVAGILHDNGFTWDDANAVDAILSHFGLIVSKSATPAGVLDEAALAHLRQHVTFEDVGTPNLSMRMDSYCPEHPRPPETLGQYQLVAPDENRHLLEAFVAVIAPSALAAALGRSGSGGGRG